MVQPTGGGRSNSAPKINFAREPARPTVDRPPGCAPLQQQPTMFRDWDVDNLVTANPVHPAPEISKARNIVVFGDSGVGKSSLINMLAGTKTADTSNGVLGCTFQSRQHAININGEKVNLWDTAGLDEGTRGRVPPEVAEKNLNELLRKLRGANGVHLLVYCMRGSSIRKSLARNYVIFYSAICRKKVPIVAVVTGLENEEPAMEDWWVSGEKELAKYKMRFDDHACVTTLSLLDKYKGTPFQDRIILSQQLVRKLIFDNCRRAAARSPSDPNVFIKAALHDVRSVMRFGWENVQPLCSVVFYQPDTPTLFQPNFFGDVRKISSQIGGRSFVFQNAGDLSGRYISPRISKGGADLLVFAGTPSDSNKAQLRRFYTCCSGEVCPLLVVTDMEDSYVKAWKDYLDEQGIGARVEAMPATATSGQSQTGLYDSIDELCLVRGPARFRRTNFLRFFGRKAKEHQDAAELMLASAP